MSKPNSNFKNDEFDKITCSMNCLRSSFSDKCKFYNGNQNIFFTKNLKAYHLKTEDSINSTVSNTIRKSISDCISKKYHTIGSLECEFKLENNTFNQNKWCFHCLPLKLNFKDDTGENCDMISKIFNQSFFDKHEMSLEKILIITCIIFVFLLIFFVCFRIYQKMKYQVHNNIENSPNYAWQ